jgi:Coenzyme PQQ synthesis protein D (PqqD)
MTAIEPGDRYVKAEGHEFNQVPDGYVIYQAGRDRVHFLNPTAVIVYELCDGKHTVEAIGRYMQESFSLPAPPIEEVKTCLDTFLKEDIVTPWTPSSSAA